MHPTEMSDEQLEEAMLIALEDLSDATALAPLEEITAEMEKRGLMASA